MRDTRPSTLLAVATATLFVTACSRSDASCVAAARTVTHLSLAGNVRVDSCTRESTSINTIIVLTLDSAETAQAVAEAKRQRFQQVEDLLKTHAPSGDLTGGAIRDMKVEHGWYWSSMGKNANGGYTLIVLDVAARKLTIRNAMM